MQIMLDPETADPRDILGTEREVLAKPRFNADLVEAILDVRLGHEDLPRLSWFKKFEGLSRAEVGFRGTPEVLVRTSAVKDQPLAPTFLSYEERGDARPRSAGEAKNAAPEESREKRTTDKGVGAEDHILVLTFSLVRLSPLNDIGIR